MVKLLYGLDVLLANSDSLASHCQCGGAVWLPHWLDAINSGTNSLFLTIGPGDFLVHHAIALGLAHHHLDFSQRCFGCSWF